jgi:hypothetical protein
VTAVNNKAGALDKHFVIPFAFGLNWLRVVFTGRLCDGIRKALLIVESSVTTDNLMGR